MSLLNSFVVATLPYVPKSIVGIVSRRYIAGETLAEALHQIAALNAHDISTTTDLLGEYITMRSEAEENRVHIEDVLRSIHAQRLDSTVSVKLSQMGLLLDTETCLSNVRALAALAQELGNRLTLDMEDSSTVDATLAIAGRLKKDGCSNVGIVSQAYLRRASSDITAWAASGGGEVRLCKGIYIEPESIAFKGRDEVRQNYLKLFNQILDAKCFLGIATHDEYLVRETHRIIRERSIPPEAYEYQMLLGVREDLRDWVLSQGHRIRVYVPFGAHWYAYSVRRLRENPGLAGQVFKAMFLPRRGKKRIVQTH